jgi:hypothetical protein
MSIPIRAVVGLALALDIELVFGIVDRSEARAFMLETAHETCWIEGKSVRVRVKLNQAKAQILADQLASPRRVEVPL